VLSRYGLAAGPLGKESLLGLEFVPKRWYEGPAGQARKQGATTAAALCDPNIPRNI